MGWADLPSPGPGAKGPPGEETKYLIALRDAEGSYIFFCSQNWVLLPTEEKVKGDPEPP